MMAIAHLLDVTRTVARYEDGITITIIALAVVAFAVLGWVDGRTWWELRGTRDRTSLGPALRRKKLAWSVVSWLLAVLYLMTLVDETDWYDAGLWPRLVVRLVTIGAVLIAAATGVRFYVAYRREVAASARTIHRDRWTSDDTEMVI